MFTVDLESKFKSLESKIKSYFGNTDSKIDSIQIVKSVQRGVVSLGTSGDPIVVKINEININKSMILLQGTGREEASTGSDGFPGVYVSDNTPTSFTISQSRRSNVSVSISWQVIEFC